jgi:methanogenic corrinoid protein MtbC1
MIASNTGLSGPARDFLGAILAGDHREALAVAERAFERGLGYLYEHVVEKAMVEVGRLWQEDRISVAGEHLATAMAESTIASIYPRLAWPVGGPPAVVACTSPERHQLGARMLGDLLALDGWSTSFLGGDVPPPAIVEMARSRRAVLIAISVTLPHHLPTVAGAIRDLRSALPGARLLVGGRAVRGLPDPSALGADAWARSSGEGTRTAGVWKR